MGPKVDLPRPDIGGPQEGSVLGGQRTVTAVSTALTVEPDRIRPPRPGRSRATV